MARPRKSTMDAWLDAFADMDYEDQRGALVLAQVLHRQAERAAKRGGNPNGQSAAERVAADAE